MKISLTTYSIEHPTFCEKQIADNVTRRILINFIFIRAYF